MLIPPSPATATEMYLAAILDELRQMSAGLAFAIAALPKPTPVAPPSDVVELREPGGPLGSPTNKPRHKRRS